MKLKPLGDRIVVKPEEEAESRTASGIVIPDTAKEKPQTGEVLEEVLVTGTRIKGLDVTGAAQAVQVTQQDILESGAENIGQLDIEFQVFRQ